MSTTTQTEIILSKGKDLEKKKRKENSQGIKRNHTAKYPPDSRLFHIIFLGLMSYLLLRLNTWEEATLREAGLLLLHSLMGYNPSQLPRHGKKHMGQLITSSSWEWAWAGSEAELKIFLAHTNVLLLSIRSS